MPRAKFIIPLSIFTIIFATGIYANNCFKNCPSDFNRNDVIRHHLFSVAINIATKFPDWLAYEVKKSNLHGPKRRRNYAADPALPKNIRLITRCTELSKKIAFHKNRECDDYKNAHHLFEYQRGHLAPLASFSNSPYWFETNYLSNITPQKGTLNHHQPWGALEAKERELAKHHSKVFVLTGTLYDRSPMHMLPNAHIDHEVPSGFWKVISLNKQQSMSYAAFIFKQSDNDSFCNPQHRATLREIEMRSGVRFSSDYHLGKPSLYKQLCH